MSFEGYTPSAATKDRNRLETEMGEGQLEDAESWVVPNEVLREIREKGMRKIELGLSRFDHGFVLGGAGGRDVLIRKAREVELDFPEVEKRVTGDILPTPYGYKEFYQTTTYNAEAYIKRRIGVFPERKKYFDMIREQQGLSTETVDDLPEVLYHSTHVVLTPDRHATEGSAIDQLERLQETGLLGSKSPDRKFYLSTSRYIAFSHGTIGEVDRGAHDRLAAEGYKNARKIMLVTVDPKVLAEYRDVYLDEESLEWDDEFKKNFVVIAGLPGKAITKIEIFDQLEVEKK